MIEAHGKDFTMGALVLAARFIAEGKKPVGIGIRRSGDGAVTQFHRAAQNGTVAATRSVARSGTWCDAQ